MAIGEGTLTGGDIDGGGLAGCKSLGWGFFFLFFFFFVCCCCCEELEVGVVDGYVKSGVGGLNGCGLLVGESFVVLGALESLIPDLQRFSPWISDRWRWPWLIHLVKAVDIAVVVIVVESGSLEERCLKKAVLLVRGVVLLMVELWGG